MGNVKEKVTVIKEIRRREERGISYITLDLQDEGKIEFTHSSLNPTICFISLWEEARNGDKVKLLYRYGKLEAIYLLKLREEQES